MAASLALKILRPKQPASSSAVSALAPSPISELCFLLLSPLLPTFLPHGPPLGSSYIPKWVLLQGFCIYSLCLEYSSSFRAQFKSPQRGLPCPSNLEQP